MFEFYVASMTVLVVMVSLNVLFVNLFEVED